ncbi:MAG: hypothetical protein LBK77_03520 [Spirochaetaceae bacterium]|jgi:hypothetical protein|nr:hypothetical protein [Spirochaetaceae bacterium]
MTRRVFLAGILLLGGGLLFGLDLSAVMGGGNLSFNIREDEPLGSGEFTGHPYPFGRIALTDRVSETFSYSVSLERDPVLRNILNGELRVNVGLFSFSLGPLFGLFDTRENPLKPGVSAGIGVDLPGIIFGSLRGGAVFGSLHEKGDYTLETGSIALGFWLPNLVNTLSLGTKKFSLFQTGGLVTEDELLRLCYRGEIYSKNVPYTISIDLGYQTLIRSYDGPLVREKDTYHALFLGFETAVTIRPLFALLFGAEIPVYSWGKAPLTRGDHAWFVQGFAGFNWTIEKKTPPPVQQLEEAETGEE